MFPRRGWVLAVALGLAACGKGPGGLLVRADKARLSADDVPARDVQTQAADNTAFAFDLYAQLQATPGNLFFSPYSISSALAMTWAGAATETATGMADALHFSLPADRLHPAFNAIDAALTQRAAEGGTGTHDGPFRLDVANALWTQKDLRILPAFLDTLAENYGAGVRQEDFKTAAEPARADINAWVSDQTEGLIPELLAEGSVNGGTRLVLTNAVYFDAAWAHPFSPDRTRDAPFHALDGSTPSVPLLHQLLDTAYAKGDGWEAVELPYSNPALTLTVIVPAPGQFAAVEAKLSADFLGQVVSAETPAEVNLGFPKVDVTTEASLRQPLTALGMGVAFSNQADLSGIDGQRDLRISGVIHQATVKMDEAGTRAAAATAVTVGTTAAHSNTVNLTVDRPFFLVLRDQPTGTVLFLGRVTQP
jgi:serpin B